MLRLLKYEDRTFRQGQFTGKEESYRAGSGDDHVVRLLKLVIAQGKIPQTLWNVIP